MADCDFESVAATGIAEPDDTAVILGKRIGLHGFAGPGTSLIDAFGNVKSTHRAFRCFAIATPRRKHPCRICIGAGAQPTVGCGYTTPGNRSDCSSARTDAAEDANGYQGHDSTAPVSGSAYDSLRDAVFGAARRSSSGMIARVFNSSITPALGGLRQGQIRGGRASHRTRPQRESLGSQFAWLVSLDRQDWTHESRETRIFPQGADRKQERRPKFPTNCVGATEFSLSKGEFVEPISLLEGEFSGAMVSKPHLKTNLAIRALV